MSTQTWHTADCPWFSTLVFQFAFERIEPTVSNTPLAPTSLTSPTAGQVIRAYACQCGHPIFFRNSTCLACNTPLGYHPEQALLLSLMPGTTHDTWVDWKTEGPEYHRCANLNTPAACNWLLPVSESLAHKQLCRACRLNRTIPDLADPQHPENGELWGRIELAKRRLVSALLVMGLPVASRETEDTARGLMFDFLRSPDCGPRVMTGHNDGLITLDIMEADHGKRETTREAMQESYRTLVGHLRHEVGHYYWDRVVAGTEWLSGFRALFGDETQDYGDRLRAYYKNGPPADWALHFVSAYASSHPWEDWAECWAHYMHMRDTVDTAQSFGLSIDSTQLEFTPFQMDDLHQPEHPQADRFLALLNRWTQLTMLLNGMSRAMGQPDFYPFVLAHEVVPKLQFIDLLVNATREQASAS